MAAWHTGTSCVIFFDDSSGTNSRSTRSTVSIIRLLVQLFKASLIALKMIFWGTVIAVPFLGIWFASSIAAFVGGPIWAACATGLLLFPMLPLMWDWRATRKFEGRQTARKNEMLPPKKRVLTVGDRLILRTLLINSLFVAALLGLFPQKGFEALAVRGDWMLDGVDHAATDDLRAALHRGADGLEWLYLLSFENPYEAMVDESQVPTPEPNEFAARVTPTESQAEKPGSPTGAVVEEGKQTSEPIEVVEPGSTVVRPLEDQEIDTLRHATRKQPSGIQIEYLDDTPPDGSEPSRRESDTRTAGDVRWPVASKLHPLVSNMPDHVKSSYRSVARHIAANASNPTDRIKALHDFVADRTAYDVPALRSGDFPNQDAETVFQTQKAVCAGYANLLEAMAKVTGDQIVVVSGVTRKHTGEISPGGHAWNAAKIGGRWYLLDPTWNAGYVSGDTFTKKYKTDYFFSPPQVFGMDHFPKDPAWQLRRHSISRSEFMRQPNLRPNFFAHGLHLRDPRRAQVDSGKNFIARIDNPRNRRVAATIAPAGKSEKTRCAVSGTTDVTIKCPVDQGENQVTLFAENWGAGHFEVIRR
jgi:transglutaminase-like putative cysteine protease